MTRLEHLRELRRQQGVRAASASRFKRPREVDTYLRLDAIIRRAEASADAEHDPRRAADAAGPAQ